MKANQQQASFNLKRVCALCITVYVALVVALHFLMGYQLHFRESRGDIEMQPAESGTVELVQGAVVEQTFSMEILNCDGLLCRKYGAQAAYPFCA